jgi:hypothetical protein
MKKIFKIKKFINYDKLFYSKILKSIGILREHKNSYERRAPLSPSHVRQLSEEGKIKN